MSATPKVYEIEEHNNNFNYDKIFGKVLFTMSFDEAIKNKYITDYKIWLPSIYEDNGQLNNELSIYEVDNVVKAKCNYLLSCLLNTGSHKCIIYCLDTKELDELMDCIELLNNFYYIKICTSKIISNINEKRRQEILDNFEKPSDYIQLLFSIKILDECIDIPSCDSIFITYPSESKIRTVQRISRCIRLDKNSPYKCGNIFIWCDKYEDIVNTLSGLKDYDIEFQNKIKINEINYYNTSDNKINNEKNIELIKNYIVGVKEYKENTWDENLEYCIAYIDKNGFRPSQDDKDLNIRYYGNWIGIINSKYNKGQLNDDRMKKWKDFTEKYSSLFLNKEQMKNKDINVWRTSLQLLKEYIDKNNKLPIKRDIDPDIKKIGNWLSHQKTTYIVQSRIMANPIIRKEWEDFIKSDKYKKYFMNDTNKIEKQCNIIEKYILEHKSLPPLNTSNTYIKSLANWIQTMNTTTDESNKKYWDDFKKKYNTLF
jgi:hypothetical protein